MSPLDNYDVHTAVYCLNGGDFVHMLLEDIGKLVEQESPFLAWYFQPPIVLEGPRGCLDRNIDVLGRRFRDFGN